VAWPQWTTAAAVTVVEPSGLAAGNASKRLLASTAQCPAAVETIVSTSVTPSAGQFIVQVNAVAVGQVGSASMAEQVASQLRQAAPTIAANPTGLVPHWGEKTGSVQINGQTVLTLPPTAAPEDRMALVLTQWVNNLRLAFNAPPLSPSEVQMVAYGLGETAETIRGTASWYGPYFHGRQTATGEIFDQEDLTAAHKTLPFGTYLEVRNLLNGKTVVVRVNDRGPYVGDRSLDLSYAAARCLGSDQVGVIPYEATILAPDHPHPWQSAQL
jgi:rare lipoprotein A (peptidoglycan hydrolase)